MDLFSLETIMNFELFCLILFDYKAENNKYI